MPGITFDPILSNLHFDLPKKSVLGFIARNARLSGVAAAIDSFLKLPQEKRDMFDRKIRELNGIGYVLLSKNRFEEAIALFKLNVFLFPDEPSVYDSLADGYLCNLQFDMALHNYMTAVALDPDNIVATIRIAELKKMLHN